MSIELNVLTDGTLADAVPLMDNLNKLRAAIEGAVTGAAIGDIRWTALPVVESGWLVCDGSAVSRTVYAALFAAIGVSQGAGDGEHTFNLPDARERVLVGAGAAGRGMPSSALGSFGGEAKHTLTVGEMPSHEHKARVNSAADASPGLVYQSGVGNAVRGAAEGFPLIIPEGGGGPHNNAQPYQVLNAWIKH